MEFELPLGTKTPPKPGCTCKKCMPEVLNRASDKRVEGPKKASGFDLGQILQYLPLVMSSMGGGKNTAMLEACMPILQEMQSGKKLDLMTLLPLAPLLFSQKKDKVEEQETKREVPDKERIITIDDYKRL